MELGALVETKLEALVEMEVDGCVETMLATSVETVMPMALVEMENSLEMVLEGLAGTEALVEMEPMVLVEIGPMALVEMEPMETEPIALVEMELMETEPMALVEMVLVALNETQVETLPEVLMETGQGALVGTELKDQDREVLGAIKPGLAEEGSSLVMAWGQALALATAIKAPRQWPSIRPQ